jgi:hypothetical protein
MYLQIVYTGVQFTPTSAPLSTSAATSTTSTVPIIGKVSPTTTPDPNATSTPSKKNVGAITGGTIGGVAFLAALLGLAFFLWRRYQSKHRYRAGPFISHHSHCQPATSGPFQRIGNAPYDTPDDFMKHRSGLTTTITAGNHPPHPGTLVFPDTYAYAGAADPHHPYTNAPNTPYFQPNRASQDSQERDLGEREEAPLVGGGGGGGGGRGSEIDDFSRGFHDAMAERLREEQFGRDTHIHSGVLPGGIGGTGIGMGLGLGNYRTEDREARSEAYRDRAGSMGSSHSPPLRSNPVRGFSYDDVGDGDRELRESRLIAGLGSAVGRRSPEDGDGRMRYALVDEVVGEDVPILHSPGQVSHERQKSRDED